MLEDLNPTTRKYPRTLQEAFGDDTNHWIEEEPLTISTWDVVTAIAALVVWFVVLKLWSMK